VGLKNLSEGRIDAIVANAGGGPPETSLSPANSFKYAILGLRDEHGLHGDGRIAHEHSLG
jgi:hypothetical protein